jgi:hypothetical protein
VYLFSIQSVNTFFTSENNELIQNYMDFDHTISLPTNKNKKFSLSKILHDEYKIMFMDFFSKIIFITLLYTTVRSWFLCIVSWYNLYYYKIKKLYWV